MNYRTGPASGGILGFPPAISQIVLITAVVYLIQPFIPTGMLYRGVDMVPNGLGLVPHQVVRGMVWELATYMFLHGGLMHILFNMFALVMFGSELERWWGSRDFTKYYFVTGIGAGIIHVITAYLFGSNPMIPVVGASGAIYGILVAYAMAFPNRQILLWFVIPVSARTLVIFFAFIELAMTAQYHGGDGVARFAHLGGMLVGYVYLKHETIIWRLRRLLQQGRSTGTSRRTPPRDEDAATQDRIDAILAKISREGMGNLTAEERRVLEESAKRARRRQNGPDA